MATLKQTTSQTVGPYFAYVLVPRQYGYPLTDIVGNTLATGETEGERIRIEGRVFDGDGRAIDDALIEIWQADALGRYAHPADPRSANAQFKGFGRCGTGADAQARFIFETVKPGSVDGRQAPHINVIVLMRGMLLHVYTRIYFSDEREANAKDPVLASVPAARRDTLIAQRDQTAAGVIYRWDVFMQGDKETVFFDA